MLSMLGPSRRPAPGKTRCFCPLPCESLLLAPPHDLARARDGVSPPRSMSQAPVTQRAQFSSRRVLSVLAFAPVFFAAAPAAAQLSGEVSAQRFDPAPGTKNFLNTRALRTDGDMVF